MGCCGTLGGIPADDCCGGLQSTGVVFPSASLVPVFISAANIVAGWDAGQLSASPVALWPDASGNGFDLTQAVGASQPTWGGATGPNGQPAVLFDGVDDFMVNAALDRPAPGTQPTFYWAAWRLVAWVLGPSLWRFTTGLVMLENVPAGGVYQFNTNFEPIQVIPQNVYRRSEDLFGNTTADYFKFGSATATGALGSGNTDTAAGFFLANDTAASFSNIEVCELWIFNALPSAAQLAALDSYASARYGAGVLT